MALSGNNEDSERRPDLECVSEVEPKLSADGLMSGMWGWGGGMKGMKREIKDKGEGQKSQGIKSKG